MKNKAVDNTAGMRLFVQVVRAGNFSEAARQLELAPSSVLRQVSALEDSLGVRLLQRTTRRLRLTEAGGLYYEHASRILADIDDLNGMISELESTPKGTLRINSSIKFGQLHIAPAISAFLNYYPEVEIEFDMSDRVIDLIEEGVDLAIRIGTLRDSSLVARKLMPVTRVICGSPGYFERYGVPRLPEDLAAHNCLTYRMLAGTTAHPWRLETSVWRLRGPEGIVEVPVGGRLRANNIDALLTAALDGHGLILVPTWLIGEDIEAGRLQVVLEEYQQSSSLNADLAIYAVYPSRRYLSSKIRVFVDFLLERFSRHPYLEQLR